MNYSEITINGEKVGLKFAFPQAKEFALAIAEHVEEYFENDSLTTIGLAKLLHTAYKNNCLVKETKPILTFESFSDFLDDNSENEAVKKELDEIAEVWQSSKYTKIWMDHLKKNMEEAIQTLQEKKSKGNTKRSKQRSTHTVLEATS